MSEHKGGAAPGAGNAWAEWTGPSARNVQLVYGLEILGLIVGLTGLLAVVFAYVNRDRAAPWLRSHYTFQIRTFWIGLLYAAISFLLTAVLIGFLGFIATAIWALVRAVKGLQAVARAEPIADPRTWLV